VLNHVTTRCGATKGGYDRNIRSNTLNANIGSNGTNETCDKAQRNRGKQMNPNWRPNQRKPDALDEKLDDGGEIYGRSAAQTDLGKMRGSSRGGALALKPRSPRLWKWGD
jgi:hypothetical protein